MITAITIENFKGISEPVRLELRPITLLFGQNSAGKSSLLHALIYAREVFERHNLDADVTLSAGEHLDLGGFRTFVHDHDLKRTIRFTIELNLRGIDLPGAADPELDQDLDLEFQHLGYRAEHVRLGVGVRWSESDNRPFVCEYTVAYEDSREYDQEKNLVQLARLVCDSPTRGVRLADLNASHTILGGLEPEDSRISNDPWPYFRDLLNSVQERILGVGEEGSLGVRQLSDALPLLEHTGIRPLFPIAVQYPAQPVEGDDQEENRRRLKDHSETVKKLVTVQRILFMFIAGPAILLRDLLKQFRYIGPLRQVPPRDYTPPRLSEPSRWANGMAGWELLYCRPTLVERVSRLLADPQRLNLGYTLEQVEFREFESRDRLLVALQSNSVDDIEDVEGLLKKVMTRRRLLFRPIESPEVTLEPADLGVGVSQMIPGLAAALDDQPVGSATLPAQLVAVEHPELNLHPRLQAEIADVFLEGALAEATKGRIFFIETHSDAFTLRLFRRVRESHRRQSEQPPGGGRGDGSAAGYGDGTGDGGESVLSVKPTDVAVWYVDRSSGLVSVKQILVDVEGEFVQPWPESDSLFEQDFREKYS
jgi:AAA ATPase domain/AAA domain, putative AbiEii toxin, Type IV TA system